LSTPENSKALPLIEWRAFFYDIEKDTMFVECSQLFVVINRKKIWQPMIICAIVKKLAKLK